MSEFNRFDPQALLEGADLLSTQKQLLANQIDQAKQKMNALCLEWKGQSSMHFVQSIETLSETGIELVDQLQVLMQKLTIVSGIYHDSEAASAGIANAVPVDGVFKV